jgi:hypothetical protein
MSVKRLYYKVITNTGNGLFSAYANKECGMTRYKKRGATQPLPGHGPLCVFETEDSAREFLRQGHGNEIWTCTIRRSRACNVWYKGTYWRDTYGWKRRIKPFRGLRNVKSLDDLPSRTVLATEVVLKERIYNGSNYLL